MNNRFVQPSVLITGGSGFIGTNIIDALLAMNINPINLDIKSPQNPAHLPFWRRVDIRDFEQLSLIIHEVKPNYIVHLAARTDLKGNSIDDYDSNTKGVENMVKCANMNPSLRYIVYASSMLVCKMGYIPNNDIDYCPSTYYGQSKVITETIIRSQSTGDYAWSIIRPTSIWGPWFAVPYKDFFDYIQANRYFHPGSLVVKRSYGFVLNTVYQIIAIFSDVSRSLDRSTVYVADYKPLSLYEWATEIQRNFKSRPVRKMPLYIFKILAKAGDICGKLRIDFPMSSFRLKNLTTNTVVNTSPLQELFPDLPYKWRDGVRITCDWIKRNEEPTS